MKKNQKFLVLFLALSTLFSILSCQKQEFNESSADLAKEKLISSWLNKHEPSLTLSADKATLTAVSKSLDYKNMKTEFRKNGDSIIIIPMSDALKSKFKLNQNSVLNLVVIQSRSGKLKWSTIVSFLPSNVKKQPELSNKTIQNILNNEPVLDDGEFRFFDIKGRLLYGMVYKNGKLHSSSTAVKASDLKDKPKVNVVDGGGGGGGETCIDWYWTTVVYDYWGNIIDYYEVYLYTTCYPNDGGGSGGGGGGVDPEEPIDQEIVISGVDVSYETEYSDDDYCIDAQEGTAIDMSATPYAPLVKYDYPYHIAYPAIAGMQFATVTMGNVLPHPANLKYYSKPKGWITRNIQTNTYGKDATSSGTSFYLTWNYSVSFRYAYSDFSSSTTVRYKSHTKIVSNAPH